VAIEDIGVRLGRVLAAAVGVVDETCGRVTALPELPQTCWVKSTTW
jgi:hypothetical protein